MIVHRPLLSYALFESAPGRIRFTRRRPLPPSYDRQKRDYSSVHTPSVNRYIYYRFDIVVRDALLHAGRAAQRGPSGRSTERDVHRPPTAAVAADRRPAELPANADRRRRVAPQGVDATGRRPADRDRPQATALPDVQGDAGDGPLEGPARKAGRAVHVARHGKVRERALLAGYDGEYF